jgi:WD40 repeat protein
MDTTSLFGTSAPDRRPFNHPTGWWPASYVNNSFHEARSDALVAGYRTNAKAGVEVWDMQLRKKVVGFAKGDRSWYSDALPLSSRAGLIAIRDPLDNQAIPLHDLATGELRRRLVSPSSSAVFSYGRFNPDGTKLAAQELGENPTLRLWNVETGDLFTTLHDHENPVWSEDGRYLAVLGPSDAATSSRRNAVVVYEIESGPPIYRVASTPQAVTFSPDGRRFAYQQTVWDVVERGGRTRLKPTTAGSATVASSYSASGGRLWAIGGTGGAIPVSEHARVWQIFPDRREMILSGVKRTEPGTVRNYAVSPSGQFALIE